MRDFSKPTPLSSLDVAFPTSVRDLMPRYEDIPQEFRRFQGTAWNKWQAKWFYEGLKTFPKAKPGIDQQTAERHLAAIQGSWEPKHEHKEAAVAYLASLWLVKP